MNRFIPVVRRHAKHVFVTVEVAADGGGRQAADLPRAIDALHEQQVRGTIAVEVANADGFGFEPSSLNRADKVA